ncbi:phage tail protein [Chitinophaga vietnamensis]|uniref:phage tail protein n=1 Tax=Chitinophaga vietnamensis TaxID=2593957 RepID=UPI0011774B7B|nr:phage tail protein [Chitinophaga vietnamensis]
MHPAPAYPLTLMPATLPPGAVVAFAGKVADTVAPFESIIASYGWLICDGRSLKMADYPVLYQVIGTLYNAKDDPADSFRLPDYRGRFLRMANMDAPPAYGDPDTAERQLYNGTQDSGIGSLQDDALHDHTHFYPLIGGTPGKTGKSPEKVIPVSIDVQTDKVDNERGRIKLSQHETRPRNIYVYYIIRFI